MSISSPLYIVSTAVNMRYKNYDFKFWDLEHTCHSNRRWRSSLCWPAAIWGHTVIQISESRTFKQFKIFSLPHTLAAVLFEDHFKWFICINSDCVRSCFAESNASIFVLIQSRHGGDKRPPHFQKSPEKIISHRFRVIKVKGLKILGGFCI